MISVADIKSMPGYGYEKDLSLECRFLRGLKQNCGRQCRLLQQEKRVVGTDVGHYKGKKCCGHCH